MRQFSVLHIVAEEARIFRTKERAPILLCIEVCRPSQLRKIEEPVLKQSESLSKRGSRFLSDPKSVDEEEKEPADIKVLVENFSEDDNEAYRPSTLRRRAEGAQAADAAARLSKSFTESDNTGDAAAFEKAATDKKRPRTNSQTALSEGYNDISSADELNLGGGDNSNSVNKDDLNEIEVEMSPQLLASHDLS